MGTLEFLMKEVAKMFRPLATRIEDGQVDQVFAELGLNLPPVVLNNAGLDTALTQLSTSVRATLSKIEELQQAVEDDDKVAIVTKSLEAITLLKDVFVALESIATSLNAIGAGTIGITDEELEAFVSELPRRLAEYLAVTNLEENVSDVTDVLEFLRVISRTEISNTANPTLPPYTKKEIDVHALLELFTNPGNFFKEQYDWGKPEFDGTKLFSVLSSILLRRGLPVIYDNVNAPSVLNIFFARITVDNSGAVPGILVEPAFDSYAPTFNLEEEAWKFNAGLNIDLSANAQVSLFPDGKVKLNMPGFGGGKLSASWEVAYPDKPLTILSIAAGSRVEAGSFKAALEYNIDSDGNGDFSFTGELNKVRAIIDLSSGDGFLKKTAGNGFEAEVDLKFGYSNTAGFFIAGSGSFEIRMPTHVSIGPVDVTALTIDVSPGDGKIPVEVGGDIRTSLGPLQVVINNIGFRLELSALDDNSGNLGRLQLTPGFKPPQGIGLSIDAGGLKGGGILDFDPDDKEYFGALELEFKDQFTLKAFGIINTRMPDGSDGFSLLIVITTEFTPLQLGFGFTLDGVGGLLGLNRTVRIDVLKDGIRTNAIKSILFPENVVANIGRIISDIKQVFPPQDGHFLICPMGKLSWGTPSIITLELGILIEIPSPAVVILGVLKALLPKEDNALLKLQVNFIGVIDFANGYIAFDAVLFDSRLLVYTLTGQMALRINWGTRSVFILSVGGFHPAFKEVPSDLQNMQRVTISLLSGDSPRLTIQTYFAVTSNTAQFGAKAELYAGSQSGFNIYGFVGFDVLFRFDPFKFVAGFGAGVALRRKTSVLMSIKVTGELSGPTPWDAHGEASISLFIFSVSVPFHASWGDQESGIGQEKADIIALLTKEIDDNRNWKADVPANNKLQVSIKTVDTPEDTIAIHPFGILTFSERLVPLELEINKFGNQVPKDVNRFEIKTTDPDLATQPAREQFAAANFIEMKDAEKLERPSFEDMKSGFQITGSSALRAPENVVNKSVDYEFSFLGRKRSRLIRAGIYQLDKLFFKANTRSAAVSKSSLSFVNNRVSVNAPQPVDVQKEQFVIANVSDMKLHSSEMVAASYTEAQQLYNNLVREKPELRDQVQIISQYELNQN